jgi:hypothetical protein
VLTLENRKSVAVILAVVIVATALLLIVYQRITASPYAEVTPERAKEARQRVEDARRSTGPPGSALR